MKISFLTTCPLFRVHYRANGENGNNVYYYSFATDGNYNGSKGFPYPSIISYDYERGLLLEKDTYTSSGSLTNKELNSYQNINRNSITAYKVAYKYNILSSCYSYNYVADILSRVFYQDKTDQVQKTSTTDIAYNTSTGDSLITTTNYYYDNASNMQPIRTVTFNSKGDSVLLYNRTALEKSNINSSITLTSTASAAIDTMVSWNMVGMPVESEKYVKGSLINKTLFNYKNQANSYVQPDNVMVQNTTYPLETRVQYNSYNSAGSLLEQQKTGDAKHGYIWDYKSTYLIADVANSDAASIAYTSFEADGSGNWTIGSGLRNTGSGITGQQSYNLVNGACSSAGISTSGIYIVSYWSNTGSAFTVSGSTSVKQGKTVNGWTYFEHQVTGVSTASISGNGNIDELRLYPLTAQMTTYTYSPLIGITSQCDTGNKITYYEYDGFGRLKDIKNQDGNIIKVYNYYYQGQ